ncbi:MAG: DNA polymerase [Chromatiaceae bacterium]|nr:DNA polymerase [Candidatus Thioaporhodococcus sediminis]
MRNPTCRACELYASSQNICIWGEGKTSAKVIVVGEAPGAQEARTGLPFQGKAGVLLRQELQRVGLKDVYITNVVKCRPPENRAPTPAELKACRPYLEEEIATVQPRAILAFGAIASKALFRKAQITKVHGEIDEKDGIIRMPTFHPAFILRDPTKLSDLRADLERFVAYLNQGPPESEVAWEVVDSRAKLQLMLSDVSRARDVSFDLETSGLDWYNPDSKITCLGLNLELEDGDLAWVLPLNMPGTLFPTPSEQRDIVHRILDLIPSGVAQNGKFDNLFLLAKYGRSIPLNFDTMLAHHVIDENSPHGLKQLSRQILGVAEYDLSLSQKKGEEGDPTKLYEYCAKDCAYTHQLKRVFQGKLRKDRDLRRLYYQVELPVARAMERADANGLYVRRELFEQTSRDVTRRLEQSLKDLRKLAGEDVNWNSPSQVADLLYGKLNLTPTVYTNAGKASTGEAALADLKHPIVQKLTEYRELEKFRSTYLDGWRDLMVGDMIYFSTKIHGTVTGRFSSRLHQVPRDGTIRNLISAPEGWEFVQCDFSQAELRIAAQMSQDPELLSAYRSGVDVHWKTLMGMILSGSTQFAQPALATAEALTGAKPRSLSAAADTLLAHGFEASLPHWKGWKEARKRAKSVNFGFLYGMREKKYIETAKLKYGFEPTPEEAAQFRATFFHLYHGLPAWHDQQIAFVRRHGYVRNLAGRKRHLPGIFSSDRSLVAECERQAINAPVQGYIGDHKSMALIEIDETFDRDTELRVVGEVHDSILLWVRSRRVAELLPVVAEIMARPKLIDQLDIPLTVPIVADLEVGPWGAGKPFHPEVR